MEGLRTYRHNHAFLDIHVIIRMCTAVHDVHHWNRQGICVGTAQILIQRESTGLRGCLSYRQRNSEDGISTQTALVTGSVQSDHHFIDASLIGRFHTNQMKGNFLIYIFNGLQYAFAIITGCISISEFCCFKHTGGCAGWYIRSGKCPIFQYQIYFYCRISSGIQNFSCMYVRNKCHGYAVLLYTFS